MTGNALICLFAGLAFSSVAAALLVFTKRYLSWVVDTYAVWLVQASFAQAAFIVGGALAIAAGLWFLTLPDAKYVAWLMIALGFIVIVARHPLINWQMSVYQHWRGPNGEWKPLILWETYAGGLGAAVCALVSFIALRSNVR